ncbi:MAG: apolipoprotein N-acyltransferase [Verrucomicrobiales bacterium]|nr:apolipoprotein N-acyltransferase [Verrucomicrobiales bacterium]
MKFRLVNFLLCLLSGLLLAACFPPLGWTALVWVWPWPLLAVLWQRRPDGGWLLRGWFGFRSGYVAGAAFFLTNLFWVHEVTWGGWPAMCAYLALFSAVWGAFVTVLAPQPGVRNSLLAALCWCGLEWVRGWLMTGFGWNGVGVALQSPLLLMQPAEWIGVSGLAFLPMATAGLVWVQIRRRSLRGLMVPLALVAGWVAWGVLAKASVEQLPATNLHVLLLQPAVPQEEKWEVAVQSEVLATLAPAEQERILNLRRSHYDKLFERTRAGIQAAKPDLVVWPESSLPFQFYDPESLDFLERFAELGDFPLVLGCDVVDEGAFNALVLMRSGAREVEIYRKIHLVPFGEYVPLRREIPLLNSIAGELIPYDFDRGSSTDPLLLPGGSVGIIPQVCFEDTVPRLTRKFVRPGPQLIVNVTNDGWFRRSAASEQHFWNARIRSVELRRPMVRSANTGVTAAVSATGEVLGRLPRFETGELSLVVAVPTSAGATFFARHGDVFSASAGLAAVILGALFAWTPRTPHHRSLFRGGVQGRA